MTDNRKALVLGGLLALGAIAAAVRDSGLLVVLVAACMLALVGWAWLQSERDNES